MEKETPEETGLNHFRHLMKICSNRNKPDVKARKELKGLIKNNPNAQKLMQQQMDLYAVVLQSRIESMNSSDLYKEIILFQCDKLREDLGYTLANPLEKLAIEQIILCWINHFQTEMEHNTQLSQSHDRETGIYWEKRLAYSSRRYVRALELLSKMRKMNLVVQVNQANNQVINNRNP